jgi:dTDP-4-dehydrorhamnose 3,5-epimerase
MWWAGVIVPATFTPTSLSGVFVVQPSFYPDERGYFSESFKASEYAMHGIPGPFVQLNHSCSTRGIVRGLHYQLPPFEQGKLVQVVKGSVWDVAVDLREGSATLGHWFGTELSGFNNTMLWIPAGFAHGFVALEDDSHLLYQCTNEYNEGAEAGVVWNDSQIGIKWPLEGVVVSEKDRALPNLSDAQLFPSGYQQSSHLMET